MPASSLTSRDTLTALMLIGRVLDAPCAFERDGAFYFELDGPWLLRVLPDSAARFRLSACYGTTEVASLWCRCGDPGRLAALARGLRTEAAALAV